MKRSEKILLIIIGVLTLLMAILLGLCQGFENDSFYVTPENTTLAEQNETMHTETGRLLPEIAGLEEENGRTDT